MLRTEQEIKEEITRLDKIDREWCDKPNLANPEDAVRYQERRETLYWVLKKKFDGVLTDA